MTAKKMQRKGSLAEYRITYKHVPEQPHIREFISISRRQIIINLSARSDAKISKLLP